MIGDRSVLAVIPARGGSKGFPGKNLAPLAGKPLIAWSIDAARASRHVDRLILSSDDEAIIRAAREWGAEAPFVRPAELASDEAKVEDALLHALDALDRSYDYLVLLQPTSPLRTPADIDACLALCEGTGAPAAVSVVAAPKSPYWMFRLENDSRMQPLFPWEAVYHRRQGLPPAYALNGAVYAARVEWFRVRRTFFSPETRAQVMPAERSLDIDTPTDLVLAEALIAARGVPGRDRG
ncbi:MAG: acylneuraminate cytidylyltransferase family protein [Proteobacteria bacterium]|nr:acylneuraminate cytidylyltransferase family protein [Pseudomonadota bacterium]